jgi:hypothetical protein
MPTGPVLPPSVPSSSYPGLQITALDIINSAMRLIGVLAAGEQLAGQDANTGLSILNQMVDSWQIERLMIYAILRNVYTLTPGTQTYTLGGTVVNSTNLDVLRYTKIDRYGILSFSNPSQPLELPLDYLTEVEWAAIPVKAIQSALPTKIYDDNAFPARNLNVFPVPNGSYAVAIIAYAWTPIGQFLSFSQQYTFPPGYLKALRYNLAVDLAAEWPGDPANFPLIMKIAMESKAMIKSNNVTPQPMACEQVVLSQTRGAQYNWLADTPISKTI